MAAEKRPYGVEIVMRTTQAHRRELVQTLEGMVRPDLLGGGAALYCFEDVIEANRFLWMEWWPQPEEADAALTGDRIRTLLAAIRVLGTLESVRRLDCPQDIADGLAGRWSGSADTTEDEQ